MQAKLLRKITAMSIDMWQAFSGSTKNALPRPKSFTANSTLAMCLTDTVDKVRRRENKDLLADVDDRLKATPHLWLDTGAILNEDRQHELLTAMRED